MRRSTKTVAVSAALATMLAGAGYALAQNTTTPSGPGATPPAATTPSQTPTPGAATTTTTPTDPNATRVTPGAQTNSPTPAAADPGMPSSPAMGSGSSAAPMDSNRAMPSDGSAPAPRADRN